MRYLINDRLCNIENFSFMPMVLLILRKATVDDCDILYEMANDPLTRQNSFNTDQIPYETHIIWFTQKIESEQCLLYIAEIEGNAIGQIRIDCSDDKQQGNIDYTVHHNYRGNGYGTEILQHVLTLPEVQEIAILIGEVKIDNIASQKSLMRAGFRNVKSGDIIRFCFEVGK